MRGRISNAIVAGVVGAIAIAAGEILFGSSHRPARPSLAMLSALGLLAPLGLVAGIGSLGLKLLISGTDRGSRLTELLTNKHAPRACGRIYGLGLLTLVALPLFYRFVFHFFTAYRHQGLAALALSVGVIVFVGLFLLIARRLIDILSGVLERLTSRAAVLARPSTALILLALIWSAALAPALIRGPDATGVFGFIGLLRKDGLGAGPLVSAIILIAVAALLADRLGRLSVRRGFTLFTAAGALVLAISGPVLADRLMRRVPTAADTLEASEGLAAALARLGRRMGDRDGDGYSSWFGGRDCDDQNIEIHPGARDLPGNGLDEDCSGADFVPRAQQQTTAPSPDVLPSSALKRPDLPEDVSLLMITVDTLRWNEPGFMGNPRPVTPNLDRVAVNGAIYDRAYALGSYTGQAVPPMLTGKYASELERTDRHEVRISQREQFAAELICGEKVHCAAILSHFLFKPHYGWNQGFDQWEVVGADPPGPGHIDSKYNSHLVSKRAIRWLNNPQNTSGRFWLWLHYMDPHKEYLTHRGFKTFGTDRRARYDHEVLFTDHHVGKVLDLFSTLEASKRTVILITSDHGEAFNEHGRWCHGKELWEEIIRVPMVFTGPGIAQKRIARQTSQIDLFPTLLDLFDVPVPKGIHGQSLLPDWVSGQQVEERPVIADQPKNPYYETRRVFIANGYKLHHLPDTGSYRFYKITDDYERGDSLVLSEPERFAAHKQKYELFLSMQFSPVAPRPQLKR